MLHRTLTVLALVTAFALAGNAPAVASNYDAENTIPLATGFRVSMGPIGTELELPAVTGGALHAAGVARTLRGAGLQLELGWAITPRFALGLNLSGSGASGDSTTTPAVGQFLIEATTRLCPGKRVDPWLSGGLGGIGVGFGDDPDEAHSFGGGAVAFGAGLDVHLSNHWGMAFHLRHSVVNFDNQTVRLPGSTSPTIAVDGSAHLNQWGFALDFRM